MSRSGNLTVRVPIEVADVSDARRQNRIKVAAVEGMTILQSHLLDLSEQNPVAVFTLAAIPRQLQIVAGPQDVDDDELLTGPTLRAAVAESDLQSGEVTLPPLRGALLLIGMKRRNCRHDLALRNIGMSGEAYAIRISAATPATKIVEAFAPAGWIQTEDLPGSLLWHPADGFAIPPGDPLAGSFALWVQQNSAGAKWVRLEWLSEDYTLLCGQFLRVECGWISSDAGDDLPLDRPLRGCRCLSAETPDDEDSNEFAEPDLSVEVGNAIETAFHEVTVPYAIELEPPSLVVQRQWEVTVTDALGDEQPITVPFIDDLKGKATFTLPDLGNYNFYLTVTDPASCVSASNKDEEENSDSNFTSFRLTSVATQIGIKDKIDVCDPRKYEFWDKTLPIGDNPQWTITDASGKNVPFAISQAVVHCTFPKLNETYKVCLKTTDREEVCIQVVPAGKETKVAFCISYNSCVEKNFVVMFENQTDVSDCPVKWDWNFGDGTAHSDMPTPIHKYVSAGAYNVTLTVSIGASPSLATTYSREITVQHWEPEFMFHVCPDGHVIYLTNEGCHAKCNSYECWRIWEFPDGVMDNLYNRKQMVRVCYPTTGQKTAYLTARNKHGGECRTEQRVDVLSIDRLCRHDKAVDNYDFQYGGKWYRLKATFKYHGRLGRIAAKTKLQVLKKNKWRRKRAYEIGVKFTGTIYTKGADNCYGGVDHTVDASNKWTRHNRAKVQTLRFPFVGTFHVKKGDLTSTHFVRVDAAHQGKTYTIDLWRKDCGCK